MPDTSDYLASAVDDGGAGGVGTVAWAGASDAAGAPDAFYANQLLDPLEVTHYLLITNSGGALTGIPIGATIDGIEIVVTRSCVMNAIVDHRIRLVKGGVIGATDKSSATPWPIGDADATYGGAADLWGDTWTRNDIVGTGFGCAISATATALDNAQLDAVLFRIYYSGGIFPAMGVVRMARRPDVPTDPQFTE